MPADKPRLLVLSHVLPIPRTAGQQQRVFYTLQSAREVFHVTFATAAPADEAAAIRQTMTPLCDDVLVLPESPASGRLNRFRHRAASAVYALRTGLKRSNYFIGRKQFPPARVATLLEGRSFDCVLFEYWHAFASAPVFRGRQIPCVLDMHDILWQAYRRQLEAQSAPDVWKRWALARYKAAEEQAWLAFDGLVAINREEERYVRGVLPQTASIFHAAMGTDLQSWPYSWQPARPYRVAYYGSMASRHNQEAALMCARQVMPAIWQKYPDAELWLVGSHPPAAIRQLATDDPRVKVTGYLEQTQDVLKTMQVVVCPWWGTYGFRSRIVETMALGVPTVATPDAVWGMELVPGDGLLIGEAVEDLTRHALRLLDEPVFAAQQSRLARVQVEQRFSLDRTYGQLMRDLAQWLAARQVNETSRQTAIAS